MRDAEGMLQLSFKVYIGMYGLAAVAALAFGNIFMAIICCLGAVLVCSGENLNLLFRGT